MYLDGALKGTIDTYSANDQAQAAEYSVSGLGAGSHVLEIVATGEKNAQSGGAWIWVDAFDVTSGGKATFGRAAEEDETLAAASSPHAPRLRR